MEPLELEPYRHADLGFTIELPPGIEIHEDLPHVALLAVERSDVVPEGTFRASLSVVAEDGPEGLGLDGYVAGSIERQTAGMDDLRLLDRDEYELGGVPVVRTLSHYRGGEALAVALEQWRLIARGIGWVLSSSSDAISFADKGEIMAACAETFRVEEATP
jgi:hypothetical protein